MSKERGRPTEQSTKNAHDTAEQEELNAHLAAVVESSHDAIISKTLQGIIRTWNKSAEKIFGYTAQEAIGQSITMLIPAERLNEETEILERIRRGEQIEHFETIRLKKNGQPLHISLTISPIRDRSGEIIGASKIARDITQARAVKLALQESETKLRGVVEASPECVKIVAPDGALLFMNQAGLTMIEVDEFKEVKNGCVFDLVAPEYRLEWLQRHQRICKGEKLTWQFEIIGLKGTRRWMETHAVPLPLADGRVGQLAVTREITTRKEAEAEREVLLERERTARAEAERTSILKDEFLATLSHELRTPLNAILGWVQLLRRRHGDNKELSEGLSIIERNARSQTQLVEDLLDMSRIISGKVRLEVQKVDLQEVIKAAVEAVRHSAEAKDIQLHTLLDPMAGPVRGDPARLQQCVWNLLSNAIKFTLRGGKIQIALERVNSHVELSVTDNGVGIKPEFLPFVFDRFRQADSSTTRQYSGLGLGLSIVRHLTELHGGRVRAKSPGEGQGATFSIELPLMNIHYTADEPARFHPESEKATEGNNELPSLKGITVLAVDDEPDARDLLKHVLEECGAKTILAASVKEALNLLAEIKPDIIISDIGMPGEDGYQFIQKVRSLSVAQGGKTPAIALTAFARLEDRTKALRAGYQTHVTKPVDPIELAAVVFSLLNR